MPPVPPPPHQCRYRRRHRPQPHHYHHHQVRDPRWGRAEEVYGEDPHLTAELAVGMITGMQGNEEGGTTAADGQPLMTGASCKHYAVYQNEDQPEARTTLDAEVMERFPKFKCEKR